MILVERAQLICQYFSRFLYNARIAYVMARTRPGVNLNRLGLLEDLSFIVFSKNIQSLDLAVAVGGIGVFLSNFPGYLLFLI
jgi:hypothetical protein